MSDNLSTTGATRADYGDELSVSLWSRFVDRADRRMLLLAVFLLSVVVMLTYRPFKQVETGDPAMYDYIAQAILHGQMPYRDVIDPKGPASMYLSAAAMAGGHLIGLRDVLAVRLLHILFMGALCMVTFLVAEAYLRNRMAAIIAGLIMLMREDTAMMMIKGTQPKLSMMLFGMLTLLLIAEDKPLLAGVFSMLSCLCWQPGLMFTGTAVLIFSRYLTRWRDLRAVKVIIGALVPLAVTALYFYLRGALGAMVEWTLIFPYSVFAPHGEKTLATAFGHLWKVTNRVFAWDVVVLAMSLIGLLTFAVARLRAKRKLREALKSAELFKDAIVFPPLVYLLFCLVNMQGGADLIPFFPFIGIFGGWFIVEAARFIAARRPASTRAQQLKVWIPRAALVVILLLALGRAATYRFEGWSLQYQDELFKQFAANVAPADQFYVQGPVEILVLLNRPNLNPYILINSGADNFIGSKRPGGFAAVVEEMEAQAPRFVALSRLGDVAHRDDLERWVAAHYDKLPINGYNIYVRRAN